MSAKTRKEEIQGMLAEDPSDPFLRYGLAMEFLGEGNTDQAIQRFQELLEASPEYVPAYLQLGQAFVRGGRVADAQDVYRRGIATARRAGDVHAAEEMQSFLEALS